MTATAQIAIAFGAIALLLTGMAMLRHVGARWHWTAEVQRKTVHVGAGCLAMVLPWLFTDDWPVYLLLGMTLLVMLALRLPALGIFGASLHSVERRSYGEFLLVIAVGLVFLLSDRVPVLYVLPLAVLTLGDAAAALAGSTYGRRFFKVEDGLKSVEGSTAFFLVTLVLAMVCLLLLSNVPRINVVVLAVVIAGFATLVEADSWRGFDNLFLPMGVLVFLATTINATPIDVTIRMGLFLSAMIGFLAIAPRLGLSTHAARVYVIAAFMLLSVTTIQNALLPLLMLATHAGARMVAPSAEKFPDLDIVAALALVSFGFLAAGEAVGANALNFFALATAATATGFATLWATDHAPWIRALTACIAAVLFYALWWAVVQSNPVKAHWHPNLGLIAALCVAACAGFAAARPALFATARSATVTALGALPPALLYFLFAAQRGIL